ncbi:MAG: preprotein translocase subunit SecE [bacterium]
MFEKAKKFLQDVRAEMGKVSWPTLAELRGSTMVVIVTVIILAVFIGLVDRVLAFGLEWILS